jgi:hypothetical protein
VLFQVDRVLYRYDVASRVLRVLARKADLSSATL